MNTEQTTGSGVSLYRKAKTLIPGGTQLLSKRPEMFLPEQWPAYYSHAEGIRVVDLDGVEYRDFGIVGVGSCILGYRDPDVTAAVIDAVGRGNMCTLNAPEEVELAELLIDIHPWAEMVRYARTGGEAMAIAVRLARAASGRDVVLFCGYHGWSDWYLAANIAEDAALDGHLLPGLQPAGVPRALDKSAIPFRYNDVTELEAMADKFAGRIGAIVIESVRNAYPTAEFLSAIDRVRNKEGAPLVVDEVTAGFRYNLGGAHLVAGIHPDVAVFAKAIGNGHPMAAIIGKASVMQTAQRSFVSSTYWTDRTGPVAALATIRKMRDLDVPRLLAEIGKRAQAGWSEAAAHHGLEIHVGGTLPLSHFGFEHAANLWKTAFIQEMLAEGYLATGALYASVPHHGAELEGYLEAVDKVFGRLADYAGDPPSIVKMLKGPEAHTGFKRLT